MKRRELDALTFPGVHRHRMRRAAEKATHPPTWKEIAVLAFGAIAVALLLLGALVHEGHRADVHTEMVP